MTEGLLNIKEEREKGGKVRWKRDREVTEKKR